MNTIYLIMVNRSDGKLPSIQKAADDKIFHTRLDAELHLNGMSPEIAESFSVYEAEIKVIKKLPPNYGANKKTHDRKTKRPKNRP